MAIAKITESQRKAVCVEGLNDVPGLDTRALQQRFDGLGNLAIDKVNEIVDVVNSMENAKSIKTTIIKDGQPQDVNAVLEYILNRLDNLVVSVDEMPAEPQEGTIYLVQGEVTVE